MWGSVQKAMLVSMPVPSFDGLLVTVCSVRFRRLHGLVHGMESGVHYLVEVRHTQAKAQISCYIV